MATNFNPSSGSYVLNKFPSISQCSDTGPSWPSCFKHLLLLNRWANLDKTWQECSLGGSLKNLFTEFDSIKNSGCHGNEIEFLAHLSTTCSRGAFRVVRCPSCVVKHFFKHLLLPNRWANLDQTWQECSLGCPLQKLFTEFDFIKNSGCHGNEIEF